MDKYIEFGKSKKSATGKTLIWIVTAMGGEKIGEVRWFGRWRTYAFYPEPLTVFERQCLRNIANFCENKTAILRAQWKARTGGAKAK